MNQQLQKQQPTVQSMLANPKLKQQLADALPRHMTPDRMVRIALTELRKTPKLQECEPISVIGAIVQCAQLGLEPGNSLGHAWLIPYYNTKAGKYQCQFQIGYRGMIDLARRSGQVISIFASEVCENDLFEFEYGLEQKLRHVPCRTSRGHVIYYYAVAHLKDGGHQFVVMSHHEVDTIRKQSKAASSGPWVTHPDEMGKKTVIRRLFKYLPVSIEMQQAITHDERGEIGEAYTDFLDTDEDGIVEEPKTTKAEELEAKLTGEG
jgi:recombination protein RecT